MVINREKNNYLYILKAIAIFSVVCAHTSPVTEDAVKITVLCSNILNYIGTMGVPIFFAISGYLFNNNKSWKEFWKTKITSIFIPWLFCETLLWLYVVIRKGGIGIKEWALFIIGFEHSTYYLTILVIMYVLFWKIKKNWQLYLLMLLSLVSIIGTGWNIGIDFVNNLTGNFYLNPLNWILFFAFGMLIRNNECLEKIRDISNNSIVFIVAFIISVGYFALYEISGEYIYYFSKFSVISYVANGLVIVGIVNRILTKKMRDINRCSKLGKYSFSVYLLHQFVTGAIVAITNKVDLFVLVLARPLIVIVIVVMVIDLSQLIFKKNKIINTLIGIRQ